MANNFEFPITDDARAVFTAFIITSEIQSIVLQVGLKERGLPFLIGIGIKKIQGQAISDLFSIVSTKHDRPRPRKSDPLVIGQHQNNDDAFPLGRKSSQTWQFVPPCQSLAAVPSRYPS